MPGPVTSHDQSNAEESAENASELDDKDNEDYAADEVSGKPRRHRELNVYETVKRWVTGERAEFEPCDIQHQLELEARKLMNESGMLKTPNHKETKTELGMWKKGASHTNRYGINHQMYKCQMYYRCKCRAYIRVETGPDYIELQRSNRHSHGQDFSKGLKAQQIVAVQEAVRTAPGVSAAQLRRNLLMHIAQQPDQDHCSRKCAQFQSHRPDGTQADKGSPASR
jgi:hypothetical protein